MSKVINKKNSAANNSTGAFSVNWDIEKYRDEHECEEHWQLRKAFMEKWKKNFPEERLICLARVYTNIEFMGCRYPAPVMQQIAQLSFEVGQKYKDKKKTKLQRTFVSASTAAEDRARGIKRVGGDIVTDDKPKSTRIAFVAQGEILAPVEDETISDEEGTIILKAMRQAGETNFVHCTMENTNPYDTNTQTHTLNTPITHTPTTHTLITHTSPTHAHVLTTQLHTRVDAKTKETPKKGACSTSLAPGYSTANAVGPSAGAGPAVARTAAKTKTKSRKKRRTPALIGTSTDPSSFSGTQPPAAVNSGGRSSLIHPPPPTAHQAALPLLAVTGQPQKIGNSTDDAFALAWQVPRNRRQDMNGIQRRVSPPGQAAPTPSADNARRRSRPSKKERRELRRKGKTPQATQGNAAAPIKPTSSNLNFSAGKRAQAVVGTSPPGPTQPPTSAADESAQRSAQRPVRMDQAAAKRALNETSSPRGKRKRPRLDKSKRAANCSYTQTASSNLDVAVTCGRMGLITKEVSEQVLTAIQRKIVAEASSPKQDSPAPTFKARPVYTGGVLKLWCGNDHTLAWLRTLISELPPSNSTSLVVRKQAEIQRRVRCGILIPDEQGIFEESNNIRRALCYQNPWVDIKGWVLLHVNKQADAWFVVVGVPQDQIPILMKAERRLSFGVGTVYMKFQGRNGRYVDVPQDWDPATETMTVTQEEEAAPPTNTAATPADVPAAAMPAAPTVASVGAALSSGDEFDGNTLSSASDLEGDGYDAGDLYAGQRVEGDDEGSTSDGIPFVEL